MRRIAMLMTLLMLVTVVAGAGELAGVTLPETRMVADAQLSLNGMGLRKKLWVSVYVAGLYLEQKSSDPEVVATSQQVKCVVMHFLTSKATRAKMNQAWDEGFANNSGGQLAGLEERIGTLKSFMADMKDGDVVEYTMVPGQGTTVTFNGTVKGTIPGDDFAAALLRVWVGEAPPSHDLKTGMLGG